MREIPGAPERQHRSKDRPAICVHTYEGLNVHMQRVQVYVYDDGTSTALLLD